jgi:hypothetical protein
MQLVTAHTAEWSSTSITNGLVVQGFPMACAWLHIALEGARLSEAVHVGVHANTPTALS